MLEMRHMGIYVDDIANLESFYMTVFKMTTICSQEKDKSELFDELLGAENSCIMTTKLITPYGKAAGQGDMLELVKVIAPDVDLHLIPRDHPVYLTGVAHVAFGVDDIEDTVKRLLDKGGERRTDTVTMRNGNLCCFCVDPEGNWIELIQRNGNI